MSIAFTTRASVVHITMEGINETLHGLSKRMDISLLKTASLSALANRIFGSGAVLNVQHVSLRQFLTYLLPLLAAYPILTNVLRFRRVRQLQRKYNYPTRESLANMTDKEAWEIQLAISQLEFPLIFEKSLQFALFRVTTPLRPPPPKRTRVWGPTNDASHRLTESPRYQKRSSKPRSSPTRNSLGNGTPTPPC
jgi:hypothetical protein